MQIIIGLIIVQTLIIGFLIFAVMFIVNNPTQKEFDEHDKKRDQHIAMLVHELRSPLSVIRGSCDLLLKEASKLSEEQIKGLLSQINDESNDLLDIVNDLLDVSKIESGKFEVLKEMGDLNAIIKEESNYFSVVAKEKGINLSYVVDPKLSQFEFDHERTKQILNNLISNAIKFTNEGGSVIITSKKSGRTAQVEVTDTGIGVPNDLKPRLFHKYAQVNNNHGTSNEKGTGLGLVVAKGIVSAHNGRIWLEDNKPQGSKFIFTLPM